MKYTALQINEGEDEVIVKYHELTPEIERIFNLLEIGNKKINCYKDHTLILLDTSRILYIESVDGRTFTYTNEEVYQTEYTLNKLERMLNDINFFRCSKSMIINIDKVDSLKSLPSNRIEAVMCNGERIMISRTYASDFRKRLRGGAC